MKPIKIMSIHSVLLLIFLLLPLMANAAQYSMITEETAEDVTILSTHEKQGIFKAAIRTRKVTLLPLAAKSDGLTKNDTLLLSLFPNADYTATIDRSTTDVNGTVT
ncbi:MAG: hypothetical protein Q8R42_08405, partial [Desulfocapsaceae bacterium]|nr:hypothetical protein [Desulfocapsaceae bacterium]